MTEREALKQPEQHQDWCASLTQMLASMPPKPAPCNCKPLQTEPVAWRYRMPVEDGHWVWNYATYIDDLKDHRCESLYTTPPQPEPVIDKSAALRIATSLGWEPKREFVGLTDEEIDTLLKSGDVAEHDAWNGRWYVLPYSLTRAIEAKLRSKNT